MTDTPKKKPRGMAAVSPEVQTRIARAGGLAAHRKGTAHQWTSEEARAASLKGGGRPPKFCYCASCQTVVAKRTCPTCGAATRAIKKER